MYKQAMIVSVKGDEIEAVSPTGSSCSSCTSNCSRRGCCFPVANPLNLPIKAGSVVRVESSAWAQALEGICSLLVPFACAVLGYFASAPLAAQFSAKAQEGIRACSVLLALFASSALVLILSRRFRPADKPSIREIVA
ncbi:MAG TPA: hypothetical protein DDW78_06730 [Treponema sp.]|nr:hypothetical protein [Treponema sp.]